MACLIARLHTVGVVAVLLLGLAAFAAGLTSALAQGSGTARASEAGDTMEEYKATSRKSIQWWDSKFTVDPDDLFANGYVNHQEPIAAGQGETGVTLDQLKKIVAANHGAFPGLKVDILMQIGEGNRVATHWTFSGKQEGTYEGLAPTGKAVSWSGISIDEYDGDGKISQTWVVWDKDTLFREVGLIQ